MFFLAVFVVEEPRIQLHQVSREIYLNIYTYLFLSNFHSIFLFRYIFNDAKFLGAHYELKILLFANSVSRTVSNDSWSSSKRGQTDAESCRFLFD